MQVLAEKIGKIEISRAIRDIVAENPNVRNPMSGTRCVYSKAPHTLEEGEHPHCIVGALFVHFGWELPTSNMVIRRSLVARTYMDEETIEWLNNVQSLFDEFSRSEQTWSDALGACIRNGVVL